MSSFIQIDQLVRNISKTRDWLAWIDQDDKLLKESETQTDVLSSQAAAIIPQIKTLTQTIKSYDQLWKSDDIKSVLLPEWKVRLDTFWTTPQSSEDGFLNWLRTFSRTNDLDNLLVFIWSHPILTNPILSTVNFPSADTRWTYYAIVVYDLYTLPNVLHLDASVNEWVLNQLLMEIYVDDRQQLVSKFQKYSMIYWSPNAFAKDLITNVLPKANVSTNVYKTTVTLLNAFSHDSFFDIDLKKLWNISIKQVNFNTQLDMWSALIDATRSKIGFFPWLSISTDFKTQNALKLWIDVVRKQTHRPYDFPLLVGETILKQLTGPEFQDQEWVQRSIEFRRVMRDAENHMRDAENHTS